MPHRWGIAPPEPPKSRHPDWHAPAPEARRQHIGGYHLIFALPEDPLPVLLAVPHLAHQEGIKAFALELVAFHHHQLHRAFSVLELCNMLLCGKASHFLIITEALC